MEKMGNMQIQIALVCRQGKQLRLPDYSGKSLEAFNHGQDLTSCFEKTSLATVWEGRSQDS